MYIPAVPGLVLTLRKNIRSSDTELGGTVTTTQTLNCPTPSTTLYDGCSNPTSTAGKDLLSDMTYKHLTASHVANLRSSSSIVVLPIRGSIITLPGGG